MLRKRNIILFFCVNLILGIIHKVIFNAITYSLIYIASILNVSFWFVNFIIYFVLSPITILGLIICIGFKYKNQIILFFSMAPLIIGGLIGIRFILSGIEVLEDLSNWIYYFILLWLEEMNVINDLFIFLEVMICVNLLLSIVHILSMYAFDNYYKLVAGRNRYE